MFKVNNTDLKKLCKHLNWTFSHDFPIDEPEDGTINSAFKDFIWIEKINMSHKIVFSESCIPQLIEAMNKADQHQIIFSRMLPNK